MVKHFMLQRYPKNNKYQRGLSVMVCNFLNENSEGCAVSARRCAKSIVKTNQPLADELQKPIFRKFRKDGANSSSTLFMDNILGAHLAIMHLIKQMQQRNSFFITLLFLVNIPWKARKVKKSLTHLKKSSKNQGQGTNRTNLSWQRYEKDMIMHFIVGVISLIFYKNDSLFSKTLRVVLLEIGTWIRSLWLSHKFWGKKATCVDTASSGKTLIKPA